MKLFCNITKSSYVKCYILDFSVYIKYNNLFPWCFVWGGLLFFLLNQGF